MKGRAFMTFPAAVLVTSLGGHIGAPRTNSAGLADASSSHRYLYAVNQSSNDRGSISVYDIDAGHRLIKMIRTVPSEGDVRGVVASAATGKLYAAYRSHSGVGMIYSVNLHDDMVLWNREIDPGVDRLAINPNGQLLYV